MISTKQRVFQIEYASYTNISEMKYETTTRKKFIVGRIMAKLEYAYRTELSSSLKGECWSTPK